MHSLFCALRCASRLAMLLYRCRQAVSPDFVQQKVQLPFMVAQAYAQCALMPAMLLHRFRRAMIPAQYPAMMCSCIICDRQLKSLLETVGSSRPPGGGGGAPGRGSGAAPGRATAAHQGTCMPASALHSTLFWILHSTCSVCNYVKPSLRPLLAKL